METRGRDRISHVPPALHTLFPDHSSLCAASAVLVSPAARRKDGRAARHAHRRISLYGTHIAIAFDSVSYVLALSRGGCSMIRFLFSLLLAMATALGPLLPPGEAAGVAKTPRRHP